MAAIFHRENANYLGFCGTTVNSPKSAQYILGERTDAARWNFSVALNIIPVIGNLLAGIYHISMGLDKSGEKEIDKALIARGIAECTVVGGIMLFLVDLIVTMGRMCTHSEQFDEE
ncbi:MAG: hypothetical protein JJU12_02590 [Chlamydiales bacterium]|nr:hypothetical protein [Chlamydiales bacterium]